MLRKQLAQHQPPAGMPAISGFRSPLRSTMVAAWPLWWKKRRAEILKTWRTAMGSWPPLIEADDRVFGNTDGYTQQRIQRAGNTADRKSDDAYLLTPAGHPARFRL